MVVENGTGLINSNSYASVATADAYHQDRGNVEWNALTEEDKEARLIKATTFLDGNYTFPGYKSTREQALEWPRIDAVDSYGWLLEGVPQQVVFATCEAALIETLVETQARAVSSESVGQISVSYERGARQGNSYPQVDQLLRRILGAGQVKVTL